jgi:hypothetical protein
MAGRRAHAAPTPQSRARATRALALAKRAALAREAQRFEEKVLQARQRAAEFAAARLNATHPPARPVPAAPRPAASRLAASGRAASPPLERPAAHRPWLRWPTARGPWLRWPAVRLPTVRWITALLGFGALGLMLGSALPVSSQTRSGKPPGPPIQELLQLIQAARQAGLSEDQIRELTLQDEEGNSINAFEYLQSQLELKRKQEALEREERTKVYLTVRDVFADLRKGEAQDLTRLREQLPYLK